MSEKKEILIIDDEVDFRLDLAQVLVEHGYRVTTAPNGAEAIKHILNQGRTPDLITVDFRMPLKDGLAFKAELDQIKPEIPLIMISGYLPADKELKGLKACLSKPLNKNQFLAVLENSFIRI
jgi:DNA-binding NtrC family response regulator